MVEEQFEDHMRDQGWLQEVDLEAARRVAKEKGGTALQILMSGGRLSDGDLASAMDSYIRHLLTATLMWPDGRFQFADGHANLDGAVTGKLNTTRFILTHVMNYPASMDKVRVRIGPPDIQVVATSKVAEHIRQGSLDRAHLQLLERCVDPVGLSELLKDQQEEQDDVYRTVYGMLLTGLLDAGQEDEPEDQIPLVSREEALAWLSKEGQADHYGILGLNEDATPEMIRESYYNLARKMHPDRFHTGPLQDLLAKVDSFFTFVTDAYNTLYDSELRKEYDRQRLEEAAGQTREEKTDTAYVARQNLLRGRDLAKKKKFSEAAGFLENALALEEDNVEILTELGKLLTLNPRRRAEGEGYLVRASTLDPSHTDSLMALAEFYGRVERYDEAAEMCRKVLKWEPAHVLANRILKELGKGGRKEGLFRGLFGG
jgi:tetratricopeptide (TPR) repeat protein